MEIIKEIICLKCAYIESNGHNFYCKAFPDGIPEEIMSGKNDHSVKLTDQKNDLIFKEK